MLSANRLQVATLTFILYLTLSRAEIFGDAGSIMFYVLCLLFALLIDGLYTPLIKSLWILSIPIVIPLFIALFDRKGYYPIFKDIFYFLSPIFTLYFGAVVAKRVDIKVFTSSLLCLGLLSTLQFYVVSIYKVGLLLLLDPRFARDRFGISSNISIIISCGILFYYLLYRREELKHRRLYTLLFGFNLFAVYLTGSRTLLFEMLLFLAILMISHFKKYRFKIVITTLLALVGIVALTTLDLSSSNSRTLQIFTRSFDEMKIDEYKTAASINSNFRGYEAYRAIKQFKDYNILNKAFGGGFGTNIDILNRDLVGLRYVPILHNGYPYILIKSGIVGLLCFLIWGVMLVWRLLHTRKRGEQEHEMLCYLSIGGVVISFVANFVVTGIFNAEYNIPLMLSGAYIYYVNQYMPQNASLRNNCQLQHQAST